MLIFLSDYLRYNIHGLLCLAAGLFNFVLGLVVLLKSPRSPAHRAFFYLSVGCLNWMTGWGMTSLVRHIEDASFWASANYFFATTYLSVIVYLLSCRWFNLKGCEGRIKLGFLLGFLFMIPPAFFFEHVLTIVEKPWGRMDQPLDQWPAQVFYVLLLIFFFSYAFMAFANFFRGWKTARNRNEKAQVRNFLIGFLIAYTASFDWFVSWGVNSYPFGYISLTLFCMIVSYTMLRHQLLGIDLFIKKFTLLILIYAFIFLILVPFAIPIHSALLKDPSNISLLDILSVSLFLGLVFSMGPLIYAYLIRHSYWLRGHLTTGLTHELKSPLGAIQGALGIALEKLEKPDVDVAALRDYLFMIQKNTDRLDAFVKNLLTVAKSSGEEVSVQKEPFDMQSVLEEELAVHQVTAREKGISLTAKFGEHTPVEGDKEKIKQVLSNLLSNAVNHSHSGAIHVELHQKDGHLMCSVADQGRGIPPKDLNRIFDRFYQAHPNTKGSGIGLTIAKAWVEAHGGKIWAESEGEGKGTKVTFTLPV